MASLCLLSVLCIVLLCSAEAAQQYQVVSACPRDENSWRIESNRKNCQELTLAYLCAAMENWVGHFGEICTKSAWSPERECTVLNNQTYDVDSVDCKAPSNCPDKPYKRTELWKYQICYQDFYGTTPTPAITTTKEMTTIPPISSTDNGGSGGGGGGGGVAVAAVVVVLLLVVVIVVLLVWMYRRNQWGFRDKVTGWRSHLPFAGGDESTGASNGDVEKAGQIESLLESESRPEIDLMQKEQTSHLFSTGLNQTQVQLRA